MLAQVIAATLLLAQPMLAWDPAVFPDQTVFEHKHQRQLRAAVGSPVVKQVVTSVRANGAPVFSTSQGPAQPSASAPLPRALLHKRSDVGETPRKIKRAATAGVLQPKTYASTYSTPNISDVQYLGISQQRPILQYLPHQNEAIQDIDHATTPNTTYPPLSTDTPLYNGTGTLLIPDPTLLQNVTHQPYFYRDNGKGGYLNGQQVFQYADTGTLREDEDLDFSGFVCSSIAVDGGRNALHGQPPTIVDMPGGFDGSDGYVRGYIENTQGEYAYTVDYEDSGKRYALWPESSITPLDSSRALCWPSIVYINTELDPVLQTAGNTLTELSIDPVGGPHADRIAREVFGPDDVQFGTIGGIRSWGPEGEGGMDGWVYALANYNQGFFGGMMLARVRPEDAGDRAAYEYLNNATQTWSSTMPNATNPDHGVFFVTGPYANADIFYSPLHLTWILVFESPYADNRFYWQYLKAPPTGVKPRYAGGDGAVWDDLASAIYQYEWSDIQFLYQVPKPGNGKFVYGGGINAGEFSNGHHRETRRMLTGDGDRLLWRRRHCERRHEDAAALVGAAGRCEWPPYSS